MKYLFPFLIAIFVFPFFASAQAKYTPGYVTVSKNDTLKGFIDYNSDWSLNPKQIRFKKALTDRDPITYNVNNSVGFGVYNVVEYQRYLVRISTDPIRQGALSVGIDTSFRSDAVFLRKLSQGSKINLFEYSDELKARYYYQTPVDSIPHELVYKQFLDADESTQLRFNKRYISQLLVVYQQYGISDEKLRDVITQANYNERDLIEIADLFNGATHKTTSKSGIGADFLITAGASENKIKSTFTGNYAFLNSFLKYPENDVKPFVGAGFNLYLNNVSRRFYFHADVSYLSDSRHYAGTYTAENIYSTVDIKYNVLLIQPMIGYNFYSTSQFKINLSAGATYSTYLSRSALNQQVYNTTQQHISYDFASVPAPTANTLAYTARLGIIFKNLEFFAGIISSTPFDYYTFESDLTYYQAGLTYHLAIR